MTLIFFILAPNGDVPLINGVVTDAVKTTPLIFSGSTHDPVNSFAPLADERPQPLVEPPLILRWLKRGFS